MAADNAKLIDRGLMLKTDTVVDATLIAAPSSTKNDKGERDPEMHQTKKGNQWHFGMKAQMGQKNGKLAKNSLLVSPYEHSRINLLFGVGCADHP